MSTTHLQGSDAGGTAGVKDADMKLEVAAVPEVTTRLRGRIASPGRHSHRRPNWRARFGVPMSRTAEHEQRKRQRDVGWPDWYAAFITAEQSGEELRR